MASEDEDDGGDTPLALLARSISARSLLHRVDITALQMNEKPNSVV